ncbi:MAG: DUF3667 domain-containing protein [Kangiellaceae bacterium]|nr:DUF3667 domain-containing protein [Kangiellaceae bacterium]MCW8998204.1 DUF3667 domain-containing protein [Kangiellaceae bacterium]
MDHCANCQFELSGSFCANCGQSVKSRRGPIWQVIGEFTEEVFAPNSKFFSSLVDLVFKPGKLSRKFIDGKRVSILPPVRMYLVISLLFFIVFEIPTVDVSEKNVYIGDALLGKEEPAKGQATLSFFSTVNSDDPISRWVNDSFADKKELMLKLEPQVTVDRIFYNLENALPNAVVLFLPLFALLMKLIYFFKRVLYFDHLIFSLHVQSWLMLMAMIIYGLAQINIQWAWLSALVPIYLAKAQKEVYRQTYWLVIPKTLAIFFIYILLLTLVGVAAMLAAIMMFGD